MKTPLNWINMYCPINSLINEKWPVNVAHEYSVHTAEIDAIDYYWQENKVVIGKILETRNHPNSDHLNVVKVNIGNSQVQIVCWAENVTSAKYVAVATDGSILKDNFEIKKTILRWEESNGMICSEDELDFQTERAAGIMILENYFDLNILEENIGKPFFDLKINTLWQDWKPCTTPLRDIVFEIDNKFITNRPDLFSVEWNAREFGAIFNLPFTPYGGNYEFGKTKTLNTKIESDKVLAYHLLKIENIPASESPFSVKYFLKKSAQPCKFDLVDMTNYIMTELWQPMHAFDADKIDWFVTVRMAKDWEKIIALNNEEYELTSKDLVIADNSKILAIAWIMWWLSSAINENTTNICIESACFDATTVRLTAQRLALRSDSSTRYEKSLDPLLTYRALSRSLDFIGFLWKNNIVSWESEYINKEKLKNIEIAFTKEFLDKKIGVDFPESEIERILKALGFTFIKDTQTYKIQVPSWRATKDISIKEDIAEEIGRIYWYDKVPWIPVKWDFVPTKKNKDIELKNIIIDYLNGKNWLEVYLYSFSNENLDEKIWITNHADSIKIVNAYSNEYTQMRRNLASNLLKTVKNNEKNWKVFKIFELGKVAKKDESWKFTEKLIVAWASIGTSFEEFNSQVYSLLKLLLPWKNIETKQGLNLESKPHFHPNKSWKIIINGNIEVWNIGFINPEIIGNFEIESEDVLYFEFSFDILKNNWLDSQIIFEEISKYPSIDRELNFVIDEKMPVANVINMIIWVDETIRNVRIIDTYRNEEKIGSNKKSITFSLKLQDYSKTITDEEALNIQNTIINKLEKENIMLRK